MTTRFALPLALLLLPLAGCSKVTPANMPEDNPPAKTAEAPPTLPPGHPPISGQAAETPTTTEAPTATLPPGHPPIPSASTAGGTTTATAPGDPTVASFLGLKGPKPASWVALPPSSGMRAANYRVPGAAGDAEVVVFYFGQGQGGTIQRNIERWTGQFSGPDGGPVEPSVTETEVDGLKVTRIELAGNYSGMSTTATPDQRFITSIVEAPVGNVFIRLLGPDATVQENRKAFDAMVAGRRREP